jgi:hypothetical protein
MMTIRYEALGVAFKYRGPNYNVVVGKAGDFWSMQRDEAPVSVYRVDGSTRQLIWQDGQPWPRQDTSHLGRPKR